NNDIPRAAIAAQQQTLIQGNNNGIPPAAMAQPQYPTCPYQHTMAQQDEHGQVKYVMVPVMTQP
ncbi:hypothetical protein PMAYCL1PPCAC_05874, partial [Pristionchus mayeri]